MIVETLIKAAAAALVGCALALAIRKHAPETSFLLSLAVAAAILFASLKAAADVIGFIRETAAEAGIAQESLAAVLKAVGVAAASRITSDICREAGSMAAASAVELAGAAAGAFVILPLMRSVLAAVRGLV